MAYSNGRQEKTAIHLITGGCRSGKSRYALERANSLARQQPPSGARIFIATCPIPKEGQDQEMLLRIGRHRKERAGQGWETVEEEVALASVIQGAASGAIIVVDCLSLWINNLLYHNSHHNSCHNSCHNSRYNSCHSTDQENPPQENPPLDESAIQSCTEELLVACRSVARTVIFVSSEVGLGIVPENRTARLYRDLLGRSNQIVAQNADEVLFMVAGRPLRLE